MADCRHKNLRSALRGLQRVQVRFLVLSQWTEKSKTNLPIRLENATLYSVTRKLVRSGPCSDHLTTYDLFRPGWLQGCILQRRELGT